MKGILGKKVGMSQVFDEKGNAVSVTVIEAGPCIVTQIKTKEKDGYKSVQLGFSEAKKLNKPAEGHLKKLKVKNEKFLQQGSGQVKIKDLREIRVEKNELSGVQAGDKVMVDIFKKGELVKITGITKGKGFAGTIKRHGFSRGPKTHGSHNIRQPGSIGAMFPERVFKGKKLPGRMGTNQLTINNLKVVKVDKENNLLAVEGSVPGPKKGLLLIRSEGIKAKEEIERPEPKEEPKKKEKEEAKEESKEEAGKKVAESDQKEAEKSEDTNG